MTYTIETGETGETSDGVKIETITIESDTSFSIDKKDDNKYNVTFTAEPTSLKLKFKQYSSKLAYCQKYKILPIFLSDIDNLDFPHLMYSNIEEVLEDSFEYMHKSRDSKVYEEFLNLIGGFLW